MSATSRRTFLTASAAGVMSLTPGFAAAASSDNSSAAVSQLEWIRQMVDAARRQPDHLVPLMEAHLPALGEGARVLVWSQQFLFMAKGDRPAIAIDDLPPVPMTPISGTGFSFHLTALQLGATHNYTIHGADGKAGASGSVAGYGPASYPQPDVAGGTMSGEFTITSRIYEGAKARYWLYINAGIDERRGAPLMVWLDGGGFVGMEDQVTCRLQVTSDNLVQQRLIPPMVHLLLQPAESGMTLAKQYEGQTDAAIIRSLQFDTVSDQFNRYLSEEVLPAVGKTVKLRSDSYSKAIAGQSSGGICAFKTAWFRPAEFSRVYSNIGSFTNLQWHPERQQEGGSVFPFWIRRQPRKNIRVWLSDGSNDIDQDSTSRKDLYEAGSWPLANLQMAQALKTRFYDMHFRFGSAYHSGAQCGVDLPDMLPWLWRDYDPEKSNQTYEQEAIERAQPIYRVKIANREAW